MRTAVLGGLCAGLLLTLGCEGSTLEVLSSEGSCSPQPEADLCTSIPEFRGTQFVHGLEQPFELCELEPMTFRVDRGAWKLHPELTFPQVASLRVGWSAFGLHIYARVQDPHVIVSTDDTQLENGDSIEIYSAATADLEGAVGGQSAASARRMVIAPPLGSLPTRARWLQPSRPGVTTVTGGEEVLDPSSTYAATLVEGGYAVEAQIAWSGNALPAAGSAVGFDFAINIADRDQAGEREQQSALGYRLPSASSCPADPGNAGPRPSCDSRTWCTPTLE